VTKAAAFLNHPSVRDHKLEDKIGFLRKKGVGEDAIEAALVKAAAESSSSIDSFVSDFQESSNQPSGVVSPPQWRGASGDRLKEQLRQYQSVGTFCLVVGGLAYVGYKFYKVRFEKIQYF
jgi:hypothetical protein